ncbi:MAG: hypothetical protein LBG24_04565 [Treponema sp.]|jgi:hypothetical protein|nr:hypothetical protein [Treponema sp.]
MKYNGTGFMSIDGTSLDFRHFQERVPWTTLCTAMAKTFRFTESEHAAFARNPTARLIAALPFAAGCDEPERTALAHLAIYLTELRGGSRIGAHTQADNADPLTRLRLIASFQGGDPRVIRHGMNQLALIMLHGYERSKAADTQNQGYNPLNDGSWDAPVLKTRLTSALHAFPCELLDSIVPDPEDQEPGCW